MTSYAKLPADITEALLEKLSTDDAFRAAFTADPLSALKSLGYTRQEGEPEDVKDPFDLCDVKELASKEAIAAAKEQLKKAIMVGTSYNSPILEAGNVASRTLK